MFASYLISLRETIEALLIVLTLWGLLKKLNRTNILKQVVWGTATALILSAILVVAGTLVNIGLSEIYTGAFEEFIEGSMMIFSAIFITWVVIYLHQSFAASKISWLVNLKHKSSNHTSRSIFWLAFISVFREGIELAIFLQTLYFSSSISSIYLGVLLGITTATILGWLIAKSIIKLPIYLIFKTTTALLILFAAGLLSRGVHELAETNLVPTINQKILTNLPHADSPIGESLKITLGISQKMDLLQILLYSGYASTMAWLFLIQPTFSGKYQD